jgi:hypothetical protein
VWLAAVMLEQLMVALVILPWQILAEVEAALLFLHRVQQLMQAVQAVQAS